jgi:hypothetical protein
MHFASLVFSINWLLGWRWWRTKRSISVSYLSCVVLPPHICFTVVFAAGMMGEVEPSVRQALTWLEW